MLIRLKDRFLMLHYLVALYESVDWNTCNWSLRDKDNCGRCSSQPGHRLTELVLSRLLPRERKPTYSYFRTFVRLMSWGKDLSVRPVTTVLSQDCISEDEIEKYADSVISNLDSTS